MLLRKDVDDLGAFFSKNLRKLTAEVNIDLSSQSINLFPGRVNQAGPRFQGHKKTLAPD